MNIIVTARLGRRRLSGVRQDLLLQESNVVAYMKERGCLHHDIVELDDELWLVEEWASFEGFEHFFDHTPTFRRVLREAGFREFPDDVRVWRPIKKEDELRRVVAGATGAEVAGTASGVAWRPSHSAIVPGEPGFSTGTVPTPSLARTRRARPQRTPVPRQRDRGLIEAVRRILAT